MLLSCGELTTHRLKTVEISYCYYYQEVPIFGQDSAHLDLSEKQLGVILRKPMSVLKHDEVNLHNPRLQRRYCPINI